MSDWSIERINRIAGVIGAQTYLEIGLFEGLTIRGVTVPQRAGVEPGSQPGIEGLESEGVELHRMTSDDFFGSDVSRRTFDLVFIDGLHTFEQAARDFFNSLTLLSEGGVILLDDTWPSDVFSSLRPGKTPVARELHGLEAHGGWHGDVYKLVFLIHDFIPALSFGTVIENGNGQTIIWRAPSKRRILFDSTETISRMTYFDMHEHVEAMNVMSLEAVIEGIENAYGSAR